METYVMLMRWTQKGAENLKGSPARLEAAKQAFKAAGAQLKDFYLTAGQYDMVVVCQAPDAQTLAKLTLTLAGQGFLRSETLRAFPEGEYLEILGALS